MMEMITRAKGSFEKHWKKSPNEMKSSNLFLNRSSFQHKTTDIYSLFNGNDCGDLWPESRIFDWSDSFLWVTVHMHV